MNADALRRLLPHRRPMLLLDRVTELTTGADQLCAVMAVTAGEPWYPVDADRAYPYPLVLESWCQAAAVLVAYRCCGPTGDPRRVPLLGSVTDVDFVGAAYPGDILEHRVRLARMVDDTALVEGETCVRRLVLLRVGRATVAMRAVEALAGGAAPREARWNRASTEWL